MRGKFFVFFLMFAFVVPVFSVVKMESGSGSMGKPSVKFKEWQVGRSPKGMDTNSKEQKSFITSTETVCWFTASVGYDGNQGDNVSPIDPSTVSWTIIQADPSSMKLQTSQKNWSGKHPSVLEDVWRSRALLKNETTGMQQVLGIGDVLGDFTVMKIQPKQVTLDHHGNPPVVLHLPEPVFLN